METAVKTSWNKGKKLSIDHRQKLSEARKGKTPWNKGLKGAQEAWNKGLPRTWEAGKDFIKGDKRLIGNKFALGNSPNKTSFQKGMTPYNKGVYKSNNIAAVHYWVKQTLGKPNKCEHCGSKDRTHYDWANKDHTYKKVVNDWMRLCRGCHMKYDYKYNNRTTQGLLS